MKSDSKLIRVDLDFKNAFNSAGHSCLWKILEGFGVPDVSLLKDIYENSSMRIQVEGSATAAIQLDTGTVQGSTLSPLLFDLFINALLRLLDTTGISHKVKNLPEWNHQAFTDDLSLYVSEEHDAQTLLDLVAEFQEWIGLKISIKKTIVTGALYGNGAARRDEFARRMGRQQAEAGGKRSREDTITETLEGEYDFETEGDPQELDSDDENEAEDPEINEAVGKLRGKLARVRCHTCGKRKAPHLFAVNSMSIQCLGCKEIWVPKGIHYQGELLKTVHGKQATRLLGVHYNMWLDSDAQRRRVIDGAIEVAAYLHKNEDLRIDQALKVVSMCLPPLLAFSGPIIEWSSGQNRTSKR